MTGFKYPIVARQPEMLPEDWGSAKVFEYWLKIFESFLSAITSIIDNEEAVNQLALLIDYLSPQTYAYISEATNTKKLYDYFARDIKRKRMLLSLATS